MRFRISNLGKEIADRGSRIADLKNDMAEFGLRIWEKKLRI